MIDLYLRALRLKDEVRSGWVLRGVDGPESVADHSWGTALLCMLHAEQPAPIGGAVDAGRAIRMAIIHDIAEAVTGDVATRVALMNNEDTIAAKREREEAAMEELLAPPAAGEPADPGAREVLAEIRSLWEEYEASATPTALFVRDMNLVDMCAQALEYEREMRYDPAVENRNFPDFEGLDEFYATTRPRLSTAVGRGLFDELAARYGALPSVAGRGGLRLQPGEQRPPGD